MPYYEYECSNGHRVERLYPIKKEPKNILCVQCRNRLGISFDIPVFMEKVWSLPARLVDVPATVVYRDANGELEFPERNDLPTPKDMVREEYKGLHARQKLEREVQVTTSKKQEFNQLVHEAHKNEIRRERHDNLKANMKKICAVSDNPSSMESTIRGAMEYTKNRKSKKKVPTTTRFKVNL